MTITYYPEKNHLVVENDGRMHGFCGKIAERVLKNLIDLEYPVTIGTIRKLARPSSRISTISAN